MFKAILVLIGVVLYGLLANLYQRDMSRSDVLSLLGDVPISAHGFFVDKVSERFGSARIEWRRESSGTKLLRVFV